MEVVLINLLTKEGRAMSNYFDGARNWKQCPECKGNSLVWSYYKNDSGTSEVIFDPGYKDCTFAGCDCGYIYVSDKEIMEQDQKLLNSRLEAARGVPVTLGDAFPGLFQQMLGAKEGVYPGHF